MNKALLAILLFVSAGGAVQAQVSSQESDDEKAAQKEAQKKAQVDAARAEAGCGPDEIQFDVKTDKSQHPSAQLEAGKALVYVFEEEKKQQNRFNIGSVTTRVGLDGKWVGANHGKSYFFFSVTPGEHRLCTQWQSSFARFSRLGSALTFTAVAGGKYYFRTEVEERDEFPAEVRLKPVDNAEGQFLISVDAFSTSHEKKQSPAEQQSDSQ